MPGTNSRQTRSNPSRRNARPKKPNSRSRVLLPKRKKNREIAHAAITMAPPKNESVMAWPFDGLSSLSNQSVQKHDQRGQGDGATQDREIDIRQNDQIHKQQNVGQCQPHETTSAPKQQFGARRTIMPIQKTRAQNAGQTAKGINDFRNHNLSFLSLKASAKCRMESSGAL